MSLEESRLDRIEQMLEKTAIVSKDNASSNAVAIARLNAQDELINGLSRTQERTITRISDLETKVTTMARTTTVTGRKKKAIPIAVKSRVRELLGLEYDSNGKLLPQCISDYNNYFGSFCRKCYLELAQDGHLGSPHDETIVEDWDIAMNEIEGWRPRMGVKRYKEHLDSLRNIR